MRARPLALASALTITMVTTLVASLVVAPAATAAPSVSRVAGADRYSTSVQVSRAMPTGGVAYLASGVDFPDALAAAPVAAAEDGRLLLVRPTVLPADVAAELRRVVPREVVIVGSTRTISAQVEAEVRRILPSTRLTRIGGSDRTETSMMLLDRMRASTAVSSVWVVSGLNFPDALAAGAVAARHGHGLVLATRADEWFSQQLAGRLPGIRHFDIAGSTASVSASVQQRLQATGRAVQRFDGRDRYHTALLINQRYSTSSPTGRMVLASGENFPDGLAGSVLAGRQGMPMYLTLDRCAANDAVAAEARRLGVSRTTVLGSTSTVSPAAAELINCSTLNGHANLLLNRINEQRALAGVPPVEPPPSPTPGPTPGPTPSPTPTPTPTPTPDPLDPLASDPCLTAMARGWADEMGARSLGGSAHNPNLTAQARACALRGWGENVGRTVGTWPDTARMTTVWMNSTNHRTNILRENMQYLGVGIAKSASGSWYYVLDFGRR